MADAGEASAAAEDDLAKMWEMRAPLQGLNHPSEVLGYFCQPHVNPFYENTCNNQKVADLMRPKGKNPYDPNEAESVLEQLRKRSGIEYAVRHNVHAPHLNLVVKQMRDHQEDTVTPVAIYYVLHGCVYQAPDLATLLSAKLRIALNHIQAGLEIAKSATVFSPTNGHSWKLDADAASHDVLASLQVNPYESKRKGVTDERTMHDETHHLIQQLDMRFPVMHQAPLLHTEGHPAKRKASISVGQDHAQGAKR